MRGTSNLFCLILGAALIFCLSVIACEPYDPAPAPPPSPTITPVLTPDTPVLTTITPVLTPEDPPDTSPPYLVSSIPAAGAVDVDPATAIMIRLGDDNSGIDISRIRFKVEEKEVIPTVDEQGNGAVVIFKPQVPFGNGEEVKLEISAWDLAPVPNRAIITLFFTTTPRPNNFPPLVNRTGNLRLMLVYYGKHLPDVDSVIINVRPQYIVANTAHGLWGEAYGNDTWWLLQDIGRYHAANIKVIGYITAGYQGKGSGGGIDKKWFSLETNRKLIKNMAIIDKVDGIFIDECDTFPDASEKEYLKELTGLAHSHGLITWGNVGLPDFDEWFFTGGGFDFMNAQEEWRGQSLTAVQREWGDRLSVTGQSMAADARTAYELTIDAWNKGIAYAYISESVYSSLPSWILEYKSMLRWYAESLDAGNAR